MSWTCEKSWQRRGTTLQCSTVHRRYTVFPTIRRNTRESKIMSCWRGRKHCTIAPMIHPLMHLNDKPKGAKTENRRDELNWLSHDFTEVRSAWHEKHRVKQKTDRNQGVALFCIRSRKFIGRKSEMQGVLAPLNERPLFQQCRHYVMLHPAVITSKKRSTQRNKQTNNWCVLHQPRVRDCRWCGTVQ